ncbi:unnamed protein product [Rhodiola kirilowii]
MRLCPHHNLELWQIIDTFYQGIDHGMRTLINQAAGGGLNEVPLEDTYDIIEKAAKDYHLWTRDRGNPKDKKGVQDLYLVDSTNAIAKLTNTVKMLAAEVKNLKTDSIKSSVVANVAIYCQICGSPSHFADSCPVMGQDNNGRNQEDANYVGQYNQGNGFSIGSGMNRWDNQNRNNPSLSYKPQIQNVRKLIAQQASSTRREHGKLPSKPDPNLRESVNAITLRGGKHIEMMPAQATRSPATKSASDSTPAEEEMLKEAEN